MTQGTLLVFGASGQVGHALTAGTNFAVGFDHASVDICDEAAVREVVRGIPARAIINAAAYTAVDQAEAEPEKAFRVNRDGPAILASVAAEIGVPLIHISTDYVFDGSVSTPYREDQTPAPLGIYGLSKAEGEREVQQRCPHHIIMRTSWVYSPRGTNFVRTMLRLSRERQEIRVVDDQLGCPTFAADIADTILTIAAKATAPNFTAWGIFHYRGADILTWYGFAKRIFEAATPYDQKTLHLVPITTGEYPTLARRPPYSVLAMGKIALAFGVTPRALSCSLSDCLGELFRTETGGPSEAS